MPPQPESPLNAPQHEDDGYPVELPSHPDAQISGTGPFDKSIRHLGEVAVRCSGAKGYAFYYFRSPMKTISLHSSFGSSLPETPFMVASRNIRKIESEYGGSLLAYPVRLERNVLATLIFTFSEENIGKEQIRVLDRMAETMEKVYVLPHLTEQLFAHAQAIETGLASRKIAALLESLAEASRNEALPEDPLASIHRLVESVLRSCRLPFVLKQFRGEAERDLRRRKLLEEAKERLQSSSGMSEEAAHLYLRNLSRRRGKPLEEVALEFLSHQSRNE